MGVELLKHYSRLDYEIIIYTARPASHKGVIFDWLLENKLDLLVYDVVTDKPRAALYIDDRAATFPEAFV